MKPIRIKMKNFGPFEDETIDFTAVKPMFLITGKTGSGKSTIFDAMTYALYGKYSGSRVKLNNDALRADFAELGCESSVEFIFSVQDMKDGVTTKTYRVKRIVPYEYKNTRGNISKKVAEVELDIQEGEENWIPLPLKTNEERTNEIANNIIGLEYDEFNQIVLLPQGKFAEFLTESSSKREETLKKIFPLAKIENVVAKLKEKRDEYAEKLKEYSARIEEITKNGGSEEKFRAEIEKLKAEIASLEEERKNTQQRLLLIASENAKKIEQLDTARKNEETKNRIAELECKRSEMENLAVRIEKSKKAKEFAPEIERIRIAREHLEKSKTEFDSAKTASEDANKKLAMLSQKEESMNSLKEKNKSDAVVLDDLKEKLERVQKLSEAKKEKELIEGEIAEFKKTTAENEERIEKCKSILKEIADKFEIDDADENSVITSLLEKRQSADEKIKSHENELSILKKIASEEKKLSETENALKNAKEKAEEEKRRLETKKQTLERLETTQKEFEMNEQAAHLAKQLKPGCKCPVCGSKTHPEPKKQCGISVEDEIKEQKKVVAEAEKDYSTANENFLAAKKDNEHQEKSLADLKATLKCGLSISEAEKILSELKNAKSEMQSGYDEANATLQNLKKERKVQDENKNTAAELNAKLEKAKGIIEEQEKNISGDKNEDASEIKSKIEKISDELEENTAETAKFDSEFDEAKTLARDCEVRSKQTEKNLDEATQSKTEAQEKLDRKIAESEFKSEEEIASQIMENAEAEEKKISDWRTELESHKKLFESTKTDETIAEIIAEIDILNLEKKKAEDENERLSSRIKEFSGEMSTKESMLSELHEKSERHGKLLKESEIYTSLYRDLNGETGSKNVFTSWLLAMNFSEVVDYANRRFLELSGGRYQFKIQKTKSAGKHGLDIAINDSESDDRAPETLSGGETFQASISLALALTDVICQHSGGIRLDSLFIDEGFGSLDQESLDKAIATLKRIQEHKMVGVISHVEAMETEIKSHIVVNKGNDTDEHSKIEIENLE